MMIGNDVLQESGAKKSRKEDVGGATRAVNGAFLFCSWEFAGSRTASIAGLGPEQLP
jgi:hypothetical protein